MYEGFFQLDNAKTDWGCQGVKASISIGGWTGSRYFSTAVGSAQNRTAFVGAVTSIVKQYKLDGVDFE